MYNMYVRGIYFAIVYVLYNMCVRGYRFCHCLCIV